MTNTHEELIEQVARVLEPQAWAALGLGDTLAYKNRRTSSLRKARAAIAVIADALKSPTSEMYSAGASAIDDFCAAKAVADDIASIAFKAALSASPLFKGDAR